MTFIQHELDGSGSCICYRAMRQRCIRNGLMVCQAIVAQIMKHFDPIGDPMILYARWRGTLMHRLYYSLDPNWVLHLDGYDKLKSYGFEIRGCIDEYNTRILWLSAIRSNKDPKEVCNFYFNYLLIAKGVPQ